MIKLQYKSLLNYSNQLPNYSFKLYNVICLLYLSWTTTLLYFMPLPLCSLNFCYLFRYRCKKFIGRTGQSSIPVNSTGPIKITHPASSCFRKKLKTIIHELASKEFYWWQLTTSISASISNYIEQLPIFIPQQSNWVTPAKLVSKLVSMSY